MEKKPADDRKNHDILIIYQIPPRARVCVLIVMLHE